MFGADFVFASGTLFVARVAGPGEQSVAGGLFQTLTQLGTALGLAVTTIVHNSVLKNAAGAVDDATAANLDEDASRSAQLKAYHAAQWAAFAFGVFASVLAAIFLRGVGVIGDRHGQRPPPDPTKEGQRSERDIKSVAPSETTAAANTSSAEGNRRTSTEKPAIVDHEVSNSQSTGVS